MAVRATDAEIVLARGNAFHHDVALKSATAIGDAAIAVGAEFERGIGRQDGGNNLFAHLWTLGGNRVEFGSQMATLTRTEPEHAADYESATTAWGPRAPDTFGRGSRLFE